MIIKDIEKDSCVGQALTSRHIFNYVNNFIIPKTKLVSTVILKLDMCIQRNSRLDAVSI